MIGTGSKCVFIYCNPVFAIRRVVHWIVEAVETGGEQTMITSKHGKLTNFLLKYHLLEEGSYREDWNKWRDRA
jgi:hypothetical protein